MLGPETLLQGLVERGFDAASGVPCSTLEGVFALLEGGRGPARRIAYTGATQEGEAVAIAAGAWLAGRTPFVVLQNSGLGNIVNPVASLTSVFGIPLLFLISHRGEPGRPDAPQHALMGETTGGLLDLLRMPHRPLPATAEGVAGDLAGLDDLRRRTRRSVAFVAARGSVAKTAEIDEPGPAIRPPAPPAPAAVAARGEPAAPPPSRRAALEAVLARAPADAAVVATTGYTARELFTLEDRPTSFYNVGAMGSAAGIALGVALNTTRRVILLDGDGALLMRLGSLATTGRCRPGGLVHVVLDNAAHESTGGQPTAAATTDLAAVAAACGYPRVLRAHGAEGFAAGLEEALAGEAASFIHLRIAPGQMSRLARPDRPLPELAARFRDAMTAAKRTEQGQDEREVDAQ